MIVIYEPVCERLEHVPVNTAMIELINHAFPDEQLMVFGESQHLIELKQVLPSKLSNLIGWNPVKLPPRRGQFWQRIRREIALAIRVVFANANKTSHIICLSTTPSTLFAMKFTLAISLRRTLVQFIMHGVMSELCGWRSCNPFMRATDLVSAFHFMPWTKVQYIVLENSIRTALLKYYPYLNGKLEAIPHPIPSSEIWNDPDPFPNKIFPLCIGFLGLASKEKGFYSFLKLARKFHDQPYSNIQFHVIGSLPPNFDLESLSCLATAPTYEKLPRQEYLRRMRKLHYICLPYEGTHYEFTASGVLLDALANAKPLLTFPTPTIQELFTNYQIGYLCRNLSDLEETVTKLVSVIGADTYQLHVSEIKSARENRLPYILAKTYCEFTKLFLARCN